MSMHTPVQQLIQWHIWRRSVIKPLDFDAGVENDKIRDAVIFRSGTNSAIPAIMPGQVKLQKNLHWNI